MKQFTQSLIICLAFLFFTITSLQAQQFKWVKGGGSGDFTLSDNREGTYFMCTDPHGNVYTLNIVGNDPIYADTFYKSGAYGAHNNLLITSYNCTGQMRWAKLIGSDGGGCTPYGIVADNLGNVYVAGFLENLGTHMYIGYDTVTSGPYYQTAGLIKLDTLGQFNWLRLVGDSTYSTLAGAHSFGSVLAIDGANRVHFFDYMKGGVHVTPTVTSIHGTYEMVYNSAGTLISNVRIDLDSQWYFNSVVIDFVTNKLYASGQINTGIFGGFTTDTFCAAAFDASRNLLWKYTTGNDTFGSGISQIVMDQSKHLHFAISSQTAVVTLPTTFIFNGMSVSNTYYPIHGMGGVMTTDTNGHPLWIKKIESSTGIVHLLSCTLLPNGKVAAAGTCAGVVTDGIVSFVTTGQDPYMIIVDSTGDLQTLEQLYGDGFYNGAYAITSDKVGNIYIGGYVEDSIWAGPPIIPAYHTVGGETDFFVAKYGVNCSCTAMPAAAFTFSVTGIHTVGANYTGTTAGVDSIVWNFGDGHTGTGMTALHTYSTTSTFHFCVTVYTNCGHDSDCTTIVVPCVGPPVTNFSKTGMNTISVVYTGTTTALDSVAWTYGDGYRGSGMTAIHTYTATGIYTLCSIAYNVCGSDTLCRLDTVLCISAPIASFTHTGMHTIGVTYTGTIIGIDSVVWRFGDGSHTTGTTALHTYSATGTYHVCVTAYSRCGNDTVCVFDTVVCVSAPIAAFTDTGHITLGVNYTGTTIALDSVTWDFGDGAHAIGLTALHTYTAPGIYHVCASAYNPCGSNTFCRYDTIPCIIPPIASFTSTGSHTVGFVYTGTMAGIDSVVWSYGDGHTGAGATITHTYSVSGTYHVCVTVYTPCGVDSSCNSVSIIVPVAVPNKYSIAHIKVYPNPATDQLYITEIEEKTSYRLLSVTGVCLQKGSLLRGNDIVSLENIIAGSYILELTGKDGERNVVRVVKN
jgi:PKD repeat protein